MNQEIVFEEEVKIKNYTWLKIGLPILGAFGLIYFAAKTRNKI